MIYAIPKQPDQDVPTLLWDEDGRRWENDKSNGDRWWVCLDKHADGYPSGCAWIDLLQRHGPLFPASPQHGVSPTYGSATSRMGPMTRSGVCSGMATEVTTS